MVIKRPFVFSNLYAYFYNKEPWQSGHLIYKAMIKKINSILTLLFLSFCTSVSAQTIQQIGYYSVNGVTAISSASNFMVLGTGRIVNISNPLSPVLAGSVSFLGSGTSVLTSGSYSYFGIGMSGELVVADISNPNTPIKVGSRIFSAHSGGIFGISKKNDILYLAAGVDGFFSVDISNPSNPIALDSISIPNQQARDVVTHANFAYVAHTDGLKIIDIGNPSHLNTLSTIGSDYSSIDIDTTNNIVYLGKAAGGIDAYNIANPNLPVLAFSIPNSGSAGWDVKYKNNLVYLATDVAGLFIYKVIGNSGVQMAHFPNTSNGQTFAVALQDSLILLSGLVNGVAILKYDSLGVPTGIIDEKDFDLISVLPNPATNYVEFKCKNESVNEIEIINSIGESVYKDHDINSKNRIDISNLPQGNYIICFKSKEKCWHKKLIKPE